MILVYIDEVSQMNKENQNQPENKKGKGRPLLENKKDRVIRFRVTKEEEDEIKRLAEEEGKTVSKLFRSFLWGEIE